MLGRFLSGSDAVRVSRTLRKLARYHIVGWALTGGFAVEIHLLRCGRQPSIRPLNDIDFIAPSFEAIPEGMSEDFLFRHVHPIDPPGKTMLQMVDPESALRVDVFRAYGATMTRTSSYESELGAIQLIGLEDLVARAARLSLDLAAGKPLAPKYARDFLRLTELVHPSAVEKAWRDHRKPAHPTAFEETNRRLHELIPASQPLLIAPEYSQDTEEICPRCAPMPGFPLADLTVVRSLLGYC
jgi:hypothetical protein